MLTILTELAIISNMSVETICVDVEKLSCIENAVLAIRVYEPISPPSSKEIVRRIKENLGLTVSCKEVDAARDRVRRLLGLKPGF